MSDVMIEARDLTKQYGPVYALRDVSFEVRKGEVLGFLGPNGAGKTTTMKILTCFIAPTSGTAKVNGADVFEDSMAVRNAIGYLPESTPLYTEMLVLEYLQFVAEMRGFKGTEARKRIKKAVEQTSLGDVIAKEIRALSKGFKQRVGLAQALVHEPPVLILDEPMSGLDPNQAAEIRDLIRELGRERTVILSTHDLAEVQLTCDRVLIISKGRLVADDTPEELRERTGKANFAVTFAREGADAKALRDAIGGVPGVASVKQKDTADADELVYLVRPKGGEDLRASLFRAAVDGGFTLLGLERRAEGLDKVFRDLTTTEAAPIESGRDAKIAEAKAKAEARKAAASDVASDADEGDASADESDASDDEEQG
ncbi:MAG: ATP-binding cassette domain-containing protein [Myxococcota bacterium]